MINITANLPIRGVSLPLDGNASPRCCKYMKWENRSIAVTNSRSDLVGVIQNDINVIIINTVKRSIKEAYPQCIVLLDFKRDYAASSMKAPKRLDFVQHFPPFIVIF